MAGPRVSSIDFSVPLSSLDPASADCAVRVAFADGGGSAFTVATYDRAEAWTRKAKAGAWWSDPVLFVERLDRPTVEAAVAAMASDMGGYWLRYYNRRKA